MIGFVRDQDLIYFTFGNVLATYTPITAFLRQQKKEGGQSFKWNITLLCRYEYVGRNLTANLNTVFAHNLEFMIQTGGSAVTWSR